MTDLRRGHLLAFGVGVLLTLAFGAGYVCGVVAGWP